MHLSRCDRNEVSRTSDAVELTQTRQVLVNWLVQQLTRLLGQHILEHNLVDIPSHPLGLAHLLVLLVV